MKFDKLMEHCFKILCLATALVVAVGSVVSCTRPLRACAAEITAEEQAGINDFLDAYASNLSAIDFEFNSNSDGDRNVRVQIYGRQQLAYNELFQIYDNMDFSVAPSSVSVSGSALSGLYRSELDNQNHCITQSLGNSDFTSSIAWSDEFSLSFAVTNYRNGSMSSSYRSGSSERVDHAGHYYVTAAPYTLTFPNSSYFTNPYSYTYTWGTERTSSVSLIISTGSIPTLSRAQNWEYVVGSVSGLIIGGDGVSVNLPPATVDTLTPWDYYNDYILPDLQDDFPGYDDFFVFPDGYYPEVEPTEPNYQTTNNVYIIPIIIGNPLPVDITDDLGNILDVLDILADLLPDGGLQIQIDGITLTFPRDGDNVVINGNKYPLPLPDFQIDGHTINLPDNVHFDFDGIPFTINSDGTITINGDTYNLPIGTPTQLSTDYDNYVYEYEIPTIEKLNIVDAELSAPDLADYVDGISFMSGAMSDFIEGIGLMPFIIACLSLGAITYVIWKIGG